MVLKANDRRTSCPCHDEFRGPRSDYVRQVGRTVRMSKPPIWQGAASQVLQRQSSCTQHRFGPQRLYPVSKEEEALFRLMVLFKQCCENIRRDLAQWAGT
ncbi:hypothetical protein TNCV_2068741 [Trichonephila clavipes]|uniref:Uncharacterized protein n=1 Tax=Trichonephila clavipes TaxID=2585209 RepID=A0A8X6W324_TRICX|nr:hypothetical protein TNCV_2068741 [Trichonephila clavipes]